MRYLKRKIRQKLKSKNLNRKPYKKCLEAKIKSEKKQIEYTKKNFHLKVYRV